MRPVGEVATNMEDVHHWLNNQSRLITKMSRKKTKSVLISLSGITNMHYEEMAKEADKHYDALLVSAIIRIVFS